MTAIECYRALQPLVGQISRMVQDAPLGAKERAALAVMVATHFLATADPASEDDRLTRDLATAADFIEAVSGAIIADLRSSKH